MKKFIIFSLSAILLLLSIVPAFAVDNSELTYLYLDKGKITIGDGVASGYDYFGNLVSVYDEDGYFITQSSSTVTSNTIVFDGGENYVVFSGISLNITSQFTCAVCLKNSAKVTINLQNDNAIVSGSSRAGIEVSVGTQLTIEGNGSLKAGSYGQAGIGGGNGGSSGTVIINSGNVLAKSVSEASGIGGGSSGNNGKVIINGGNVTAIGGSYGAGIGGGNTGSGGEIIINGGTVTATGGTSAAGIGGGWYGSMGNIIINGGSVKATAGSGASSIGSGAGVSSDKIYNSLGEELYLAKVSVSADDINEIFINGTANNINSFHSGEKYFYFYLPCETYIIAADSDSASTEFFKAVYSSSFSVESVTPFACVDSASVECDDVIRGISCGLTGLDDYFTFADGFSFSYNSSVIGTGTEVLLNFNSNPVFTYTALLYGDIDGDGYYDGQDAMLASLMYWGHISADNMDSIYFEAADVNRSGQPDSEDISVLEKAGLILSEVPQTSEGEISTESAQWIEYVSLVDQTQSDDSQQQQPTENDTVSQPSFIETLKSLIYFILNFLFDNLIVLFLQ